MYPPKKLQQTLKRYAPIDFYFRIPIVKNPRRFLKVDKSFETTSEITDRTTAVGEAFGIGIDEEREHPVYRGFYINIERGDIIYITGESGSGKSILLKEIAKVLRKSNTGDEGNVSFGEVMTDSDIEIDPNEILVDGVGSDITESLKCLSLAGLNDAFLFVRRFKELSDGQKYRYKIAKMLASDASVWIFDEFAATLDRKTAKIVAFCLQKTARRTGRTVILATSHEDLFDDIQPSVFIRKGWSDHVVTEYYPNKINKVCSLMKQMTIRAGSLKDYEKFADLHYRAGTPWGVKKIYVIELSGRTVGVIIYSTPRLTYAGRSRFLNYTPKPEEVNRNFLILSRVIVHPKYRGIGLGSRLVRETLPLAGSKYVETIAVMARYHPIFVKAGMVEVPFKSRLTKECQKIIQSLQKYGFNPAFCSSKNYNLRVLRSLNKLRYNDLAYTLTKNKGGGIYLIFKSIYNQKIPSAEKIRDDLSDISLAAKLIKNIAITAQQKKYYIWKNKERSPTNNQTIFDNYLFRGYSS